ncbi:hypothetical protein [Pararhodonellum marinum]|uniref:hypothetical protein n=1 Tax=Pararhodonellum marinum TaxID=2755358 RepID=UPI00188E51C0|nr:hypothetical protein [Pararhodonellum marinum]
MKKILSILFCIITTNSYSQGFDQNIEQRAINFLADSILKSEKHVRIFRFDGRIDKGYFDTESTIISMWGLPFCKQSEDRQREEAGLTRSGIDWNKEGVKLEKQLRSLSQDSTTNYEEVRLEVPKGIKKVSAFKNRKDKVHPKNRWNRWRNPVFGLAHDLYVFSAIEFEDIFLVTINSNEVNGSTGIIYHIILNKNGDVKDWCRTTYIS